MLIHECGGSSKSKVEKMFASNVNGGGGFFQV